MVLLAGTVSGIIVLSVVILSFKRPSLAVGPMIFGSITVLVFMRTAGLGHGAMLTMLAILILGTIAFVTRSGDIRPVFRFTLAEMAIVLLGLVCLLSLVRTPSPTYGLDKIIRFLGWIIPLTIYTRLIASSREQMEKTLRSLSTFACVVMIFYVFLYFTIREAFMESDRFGGLGLAWYCAICMSLAVYSLFRGSFLKKLFTVFAMICGLFAIGASGGRGAFFSVIIAAAITFMSRRGLVRSMVALVGIIGAAFIVKSYLISAEMKMRLSDLDLQASARPLLWLKGLRHFLNHPFLGGGAGSFSHFYEGVDYPAWPHNTWLEIGGEQGVIGLALLLAAVIPTGITILKLRGKRGDMMAISKSLQMLFWIGILNTLVSLDVNRQVGLFASIGFMAGIRRWMITDKEASVIALDTVEYTDEYPDWRVPGEQCGIV